MKLTKPLHYLTLDPVNALDAAALAAGYGLDLEIVEPRDLPRLGRERAALVVDWDFLPEDDRAALLKDSGVQVVAVHGYNLDDGVARFLPRRGIRCGKRLDRRLFQGLADDGRAA